MKKARSRGLNVAGVVLTGGVSFLPGIERCFSKALGVPARVAAPCCLPCVPKHLDSPIYSTVVGLVVFGANLVKHTPVDNESSPQRNRKGPLGWYWKVIELFEGMFN